MNANHLPVSTVVVFKEANDKAIVNCVLLAKKEHFIENNSSLKQHNISDTLGLFTSFIIYSILK